MVVHVAEHWPGARLICRAKVGEKDKYEVAFREDKGYSLHEGPRYAGSKIHANLNTT